MTSRAATERRKSYTGNDTAGFLRPDAAQGSGRNPTSSNINGNRLTPSSRPPQTASSINSQRPHSAISAASRGSCGESIGAAAGKSKSRSIASSPRTLASSRRSVSSENMDKSRAVRTLPLWVHAADDEDHIDVTKHLLPRTPPSARPVSHHYMPTPNYMPTPKSSVPGRKFDHIREGVPVTLTAPVSETAAKWKSFAQSSAFNQADPPASSRGQIMDDEWMKENMPDLEQLWEPIDKEKEEKPGFWFFSPAKRARKVQRFHRTVMNHPMVPAVIRMIVLTFSVLALSLASSIFHKSDNASCDNNSSTWMAIIVDAIAICYTLYITYDEYTSKPLGLRSHNAKMWLIFLDLGFIAFQSANLSLAFQALTDEQWACKVSRMELSGSCPFTRPICVRQKALTATLFIALLAWIGTFTISTLRLIHRIAK